MSKKWIYRTGGIPDEMFVRGKVPMTKAEIRAVTIAKARLAENDVIWDIGAGTGSISVEAALATSGGHVYAVERDDDAVRLIRQNAVLFDAQNVTVCHGSAPEALYDLPRPHRVFIGGSGGSLREILSYVHEILPPGGRIVVNAVVMETFIAAVEMFKSLDITDVEVTQVSVSKTQEVGTLHMFKAHNPVFIVSGEKQ